MLAEINTLVGMTGMILLLVAFVLNLFKKITQDSRIYVVLNIVGCALLLCYAYALKSLPFIVLEAVWGLFAVYKFIIIYKKR